MKILAIETATEACSAAVLLDGEVVERYEIAPRRHNELILPMCEAVLSESGVELQQLDAIAFGCGPGAFTGVRIAAGVTQGIAFAHDLPVIPISTLANLAQQATVKFTDSGVILAAIDARMDEVYWALYKQQADGLVSLVGQESVQAPSEISVDATSISFGLGSGWGTYVEKLKQKTQLVEEFIDGGALPRAKFTALLAQKKYLHDEGVDAANALPVYLRDNVVHQR